MEQKQLRPLWARHPSGSLDLPWADCMRVLGAGGEWRGCCRIGNHAQSRWQPTCSTGKAVQHVNGVTPHVDSA